MSFQSLTIQQEYRSPQNNIVTEFYIPVLEKAVSYKRSVGYFSSTSLVQITKGVLGLIKNGGTIDLVASPYLSKEDEEAIRVGYENRTKIIENALNRSLQEDIKNPFSQERLNLLACLIEKGILNIKIAFTENEKEKTIGMYHEKLGLMEDASGNKIAFSGSMNESYNAMVNNYETVDVFCSWKSESEKTRVLQKEEAFSKIWGNYDSKLKVMSFPSIEKSILDKYKRHSNINFNLDKEELTKKTEYGFSEPEPLVLRDSGKFIDFNGEKKARPHQVKAIENFIQNNYQSLFAMATGTGKTLTSLFSLNELAKNVLIKSVLIVVPLKDLVDQWQEDIEPYFNGEIITVRSGLEWKEKLSDISLLKLLDKEKYTSKLIIITTYDSFCLNDEKILNSLDIEHTLIIADEVHKFGAVSYQRKLPEKIKYRIGLSATPKRPYDEKGTSAIFDYFCPSENFYEFSIKDAIDADMLCHYDYHPILVSLTDFEMDDYEIISEKISRLSVIVNNSEAVTKEEKESLEQLLKQRHRIIERASNKKEIFLDKMLEEIKKYKDKTIIFAPDGKDENGNDLLNSYKTDLWQKLMSKGKIISMKEYVQGTEKTVIDSFTQGGIDIIFAKQRLNEGIDIPAAKRAFFIASSTSEREFIQRRGRVLRKHSSKNKAEIFDFIVIPSDLNSKYAHSIIDNEIKRAMDFAATADNYKEIEQILRKYL